jgi:hypothetical protein
LHQATVVEKGGAMKKQRRRRRPDLGLDGLDPKLITITPEEILADLFYPAAPAARGGPSRRP